MDNTIELSKKALEFVRSRRNKLTPDQYVSMVLENISDIVSLKQVSPEGFDLLDIVEGRPQEDEATRKEREASQAENSIQSIFSDLQQRYPARIPPEAFLARCEEQGLTASGIKRAKDLFWEKVKARDVAETPGKAKTIEIIDNLRKKYGNSIPEDVFRKICAEFGIHDDDIETSARTYMFLLTAEKSESSPQVNPQAKQIYDYLKSVYKDSIPLQIFRRKCQERGLSAADITIAEQSLVHASHGEGEKPKAEAAPQVSDKVSRLFTGLKAMYNNQVPKTALYQKCMEIGLSDEEVRSIEKMYTESMINRYNTVIEYSKSDKKSDFMDSVLDTNIIKLLEQMREADGSLVPEKLFLQRCLEIGYKKEEIEYAAKKYREYASLMNNVTEVRQVNSKAYIILNHLLKAYHGKVPYKVFYMKCKSIGLTRDMIDEVFSHSRDVIVKEQNDDRFNLSSLDETLAGYTQANQ